jgi:hypothetical protein
MESMPDRRTLYAALTPEAASAALLELGHQVAPESLALEARGGRWLAHLPNGLMAWFAADPGGLAALRRQRRVLRALARCRVSVPRVITESGDGAVDVRIAVPGVHDGLTVHHRIREDPVAAARVGAALGAALAEMRRCVRAEDVAPWLPRVPEWPSRARGRGNACRTSWTTARCSRRPTP